MGNRKRGTVIGSIGGTVTEYVLIRIVIAKFRHYSYLYQLESAVASEL